jgi:hypothetical protein
MILNADDCKHQWLHFGSGGFYVFCKMCNCKWVAVKHSDDYQPDTTRGRAGLTDDFISSNADPRDLARAKILR